MTRITLALGLLLPTVLASGCSWDEELEIRNLTGTVVIPAEAATRDFPRETGIETVTDVRLIGPVYLGLYSSVAGEDVVQSYPHPDVGPLFGEDLSIGDAYPYGGTTVGNFRPVCFQDMVCRVVSGRYVDFDGMVDWFANVLEDPIVDAAGAPIATGEQVRQSCLSTFDFTSDEELRLTVTEDRNNDGEMNEGDLDFVLREDGNFEAEFIIWQQEYAENDDGTGFTLWGFMDTPAAGDGQFTSCNSSQGFNVDEYSADFQSGAAFRDILNRPSLRLERGDWVSGLQDFEGSAQPESYGYVYQSPDDFPEIWINHVID